MNILAVLVFFGLWLSEVSCEYKRMCYFTNWSQYRPLGGKFIPEDIDPFLCNHIIFAHVNMVSNKLISFEWNDETTSLGPGLYARTIALKAKNPNLRVSLSVGGSSFDITRMTVMLSREENRSQFIQNAIYFLRYRGFDGLDLDFHYPGSYGSPPQDKLRFTSLLQEIRSAFEEEALETGRERLFLTCAVSALERIIQDGYEIEKISEALDYVNLLAYDFHEPWTASTAFHSALYPKFGDTGPRSTHNVDWAVKYWISNGCPRHKLLLSLNTFARGYTLTERSDSGVGAPSDGTSPPGAYTKEPGFYSYFEICDMLMSGKALRMWSADQRVPYLLYDDSWISYEDQYSLSAKVNYIKSEGLGGASLWSFELDDFQGQFCLRGSSPLLKVIKEGLENETPPSPSTTEEPSTTERPTTTIPTESPTTAKEPATTEAPSTTTTESPSTTITPTPTTATTESPTPTTTTTTTELPSTTTKSDEEIAREVCEANGDGEWAFPGDVTRYVWCHGGYGFVRHCQLGTVFDPDEQNCVEV